ncbi:hypothetical protein C8R43DRAFT_1115029 [Mycena crocata]|nr:hypothetical protein C8R43DRAFT_1115029 [Mycena crocata]
MTSAIHSRPQLDSADSVHADTNAPPSNAPLSCPTPRSSIPLPLPPPRIRPLAYNPRRAPALPSATCRPPPSQVRCIPALCRPGVHIQRRELSRGTRQLPFSATNSQHALIMRVRAPYAAVTASCLSGHRRPATRNASRGLRPVAVNSIKRRGAPCRDADRLPQIYPPSKISSSTRCARRRQAPNPSHDRSESFSKPPQCSPDSFAVAPFPPTELYKVHQRDLRISRTPLTSDTPNRRVAFLRLYNARNDGNSAKLRGVSVNLHPQETKRTHRHVPQTANRGLRESWTPSSLVRKPFCKAVKARPRIHKHTTHPGHAKSTRARCEDFLRRCAAWNWKNPAEIAGVSDSRGAERTDGTYGCVCRTAERRPRQFESDASCIREDFCEAVKAGLEDFEDKTYLGTAESARGRCGELVRRYTAWNRGNASGFRGAVAKMPRREGKSPRVFNFVNILLPGIASWLKLRESERTPASEDNKTKAEFNHG